VIVGNRRELSVRGRVVNVEKPTICLEAQMSSENAPEFARYARLCVKLAQEADTPELREQLFQQAREWMRAVLEQEDAERSVN
jgi:hypothetical protein